MFTGIIQELGVVVKSLSSLEGKKIQISCHKIWPELKVDDSVAIDGVCQTVVSLASNSFEVDCVHTTLQKTTLGQLHPGSLVNLELALRPMDRLGGHLVQGHVNGRGKILNYSSQGKNILLWVELPTDLLAYVVKEGSICLDGISLTVAEKNDIQGGQQIAVSIIPHTWQHTNLNKKRIGDFLNIEVDILAKYVESMLTHHLSHLQSNKNAPSKWVQWSSERGYSSEVDPKK